MDEITIAVLPAGSANDWTRMYRIPKDYGKAVETILEGRVVCQDVAKVEYLQSGVRNERYMVNVAGVGWMPISATGAIWPRTRVDPEIWRM